MKFFLIDDDMGVIQTLKNIIESSDLGDVVGYTTDSTSAASEVLSSKPDIVLVDFLMPEKDGLTVIEEISRYSHGQRFIMISQISDQQLISDAYSYGIEFFIHKPINVIEVKSVIEKVREAVRMEGLLKKIKTIMGDEPLEEPSRSRASIETPMDVCKKILNELGMIGEKGSNDILGIMEFLISNSSEYDKNTISDYGKKIDVSEKVIRQRIRRALKKGMTNLASLGLEDYANPTFEAYSNTLFDFSQIRVEMDALRGKRNGTAKVNVDKFIPTLFLYFDH